MSYTNQNKVWYMPQAGFEYEKSFFHAPKTWKAQLWWAFNVLNEEQIFYQKSPKRNLGQYPHKSALQAPYFACAEIWWIAMFLAYQRASRPYKSLVFDDFTFFFFTCFSK